LAFNPEERVRAEAKYRKLQRVSETTSAAARYEAERRAQREKTSRLKSLRLAHATEPTEGVTPDRSPPTEPGPPMDASTHLEHIYRVGEVVRFLADPRISAAEGDYEISGLLPRGEQPKYRIKSVRGGHERVALEDQLSRA